MHSLDPDQVDAHVLRRQHLAPHSKCDDVVQTVKDISGLYAASAATPYLSLLARIPHFRREQLDNELYVRRTLGRIRCMRKAIYILPSDLLAAAHWATRSLTVEPRAGIWSIGVCLVQSMSKCRGKSWRC